MGAEIMHIVDRTTPMDSKSEWTVSVFSEFNLDTKRHLLERLTAAELEKCLGSRYQELNGLVLGAVKALFRCWMN